MVGPNPQHAHANPALAGNPSVIVTPPGCVTGPPVLQATIKKVAPIVLPEAVTADTRDLVMVKFGGPINVIGGGIVVDKVSKSAPPQLLVL